MKTELILALDVDRKESAMVVLKKLGSVIKWVKVGTQLFVSEGPAVVEVLKKMGYNIFLDLKLHDIPNTVANTVKTIRSLGVDMITVHVSGGSEMLISAKKEAGRELKVIGVTVLTSLSENNLKEMGVIRSMKEQVEALALLAEDCGLDGIVCSPLEAGEIRKNVGEDFLLVTPGIRLDTQREDDQKRSLSPAEIKDAGVNFIVVGRPILRAEDPLEMTKKILSMLG